MSSKLVLALIMMISANSAVVRGEYASFYPERHCAGEERFGAELEYSCRNLPRRFSQNWRQLSLDTHGACVTVYDKLDCEGRELGNFNAPRCRNIFFLGEVKSFRKCSGRTNSAFLSG